MELNSLPKLTQQILNLPYIASAVKVQEYLNFLIQIFNNSSITRQSALLLVMSPPTGLKHIIIQPIIMIMKY